MLDLLVLCRMMIVDFGVHHTCIRRSCARKACSKEGEEDGDRNFRVVPWIGLSSIRTIVIMLSLASSNSNRSGLLNNKHLAFRSVVQRLWDMCGASTIQIRVDSTVTGHFSSGTPQVVSIGRGAIVDLPMP
jgi:hypothetical protein